MQKFFHEAYCVNSHRVSAVQSSTSLKFLPRADVPYAFKKTLGFDKSVNTLLNLL